MAQWIFRAIFLLLAIALVFAAIDEKVNTEGVAVEGISDYYMYFSVGTCFAVLVLGFLIDFLMPRKSVSTLSGVFFGVVVGLLIGLALCKVVEMITGSYGLNSEDFLAYRGVLFGLLYLLCVYLTITFIVQTKDDFRFIIPYVEFSKQTKGMMAVLLDTSVIIDGRIADIAATGIMNSPMIVPRFILNELQLVADSGDRLKRNRGRRGLDILNKMRNDDRLDIVIQEVDLNLKERGEAVDLQLVAAAKKLEARVMTNDYNLNKVAKLRGVEVININDLATAMKSIVLPGETLNIKMVKPGDQYGQGIGYLEDGTMIVVENGRSVIGKDVDIVVTSALQTSAGRMIFGKLGTADNDGVSKKNSGKS
ncbi:MAG: PIN domain-containing protein [Phycisphaerae bacterium]|nr:PIN domain-containing protein [Phycisphaerae bacterium]